MQIAFGGNYDDEFKVKYSIRNSSSYAFKDRLEKMTYDETCICKSSYRPFDERFIYYKVGFTSRPAYEIMRHFLSRENLGLSFVKFGGNNDNASALINNTLIECCQLVGHSGHSSFAPLYLYDINGKTSNFTPEFLAYKAKHKILKDKNEEQILAFIYANLYNPKYRSKYLEYLKIGFPKVSFEVSVKEFERFEKLGSELIKLHLMQEIPQDEIDFIFLKESKKPNFKIAKYQEKERFVENKIILNEDLAISPIGAEIWNYTIGGYQVLKQWLKYRKEYVCTKEELETLT